MKIRRKLPKLPRMARPLYVVGFTGAPPAPAEVQTWFDLEYGGPLRFREDHRSDSSGDSPLLVATHGPWEAVIRIALQPGEAEQWQSRLSWGHPQAGCVTPATGTPGKTIDLILHAARLARGLTLLTDGTAYDVVTGSYLNPSDWTDRPLSQFLAVDHITVSHTESPEPGKDWFYTKGLAKFGLDELETFRPKALPSRSTLDDLADIAAAFLLNGRSPNIGTKVPLQSLGIAVNVLHHRTASPSEPPLTLREITWERLEGRPPL
jgi:hypothetical protein